MYNIQELLVDLSSRPETMGTIYFQRRNSIHSRTKPVQLEILNVRESMQVSAITFSVAEIQHSDLVRNLTGSQHLKSCQSTWWSGELTISAGVSLLERFCCWEDSTRGLTQSWSLLPERLPRQTLPYHMKQCKDIKTTSLHVYCHQD